MRPLAPQAPLALPALRTRPMEDQGPSLSIEMQDVIARVISQGITGGLHQRDSQPPRSVPARHIPQEAAQGQRPPSPHSSMFSKDYIWGEETRPEQDLSGDEQAVPDKPAFI